MIKRYIFLFILLGITKVNAQSYVGIWHGYVTSFRGSGNAVFSLDVKTQTGNIISGKAYVDNQKYPTTAGTLDFIGYVKGNTCKITELSIAKSVIAPAISDWSLCIKYLNLALKSKQQISYLTGLWNGSTFEGSQCDPGEVYLKKYSSLSAAGDSIPQNIKSEMLRNNSSAITFMGTNLTKPIILDVTSRLVTIELKDYLKEDNDTVSVYYNRRLFINRKRIQKKPYQQKIRIDRVSGLNEIIVYANNLGDIPPNTSTLIVRDGETSQRVRIESSMQTSAVVYLRYVSKRDLPYNIQIKPDYYTPPQGINISN